MLGFPGSSAFPSQIGVCPFFQFTTLTLLSHVKIWLLEEQNTQSYTQKYTKIPKMGTKGTVARPHIQWLLISQAVDLFQAVYLFRAERVYAHTDIFNNSSILKNQSRKKNKCEKLKKTHLSLLSLSRSHFTWMGVQGKGGLNSSSLVLARVNNMVLHHLRLQLYNKTSNATVRRSLLSVS